MSYKIIYMSYIHYLLIVIVILLFCLFSPNIVYLIHKRWFVWYDDDCVIKTPLNDGDKIEITYLPPCRNAPTNKNPYIGMTGIVQDFNGKSFNLFTGNSYLIITSIHGLQFKKLTNE